MSSSDDEIRKRIEKDIALFYKTIDQIKLKAHDERNLSRIIELSEMYASDSKNFLEKGDFYTSFASINYAHGLLDAVKEIIK
jgi:uncharacterized protein